MPRAEGATANQNIATKREFSRPWTFRAFESGYVVYDAHGIEMTRVSFTASEMREHFPHGKTHDEALRIARYIVMMVNNDPRKTK